jgi:hypothetical protein
MVNTTTTKKYHVSQNELRKFLEIPDEFEIEKLIIGNPTKMPGKSTHGKNDKSWLIVIAKEGDANDDAFTADDDNNFR